MRSEPPPPPPLFPPSLPPTLSPVLHSPASSPFLRNRLSDASISREHVRVEALSGGGGGDGGAPGGSPSARVTVVGSNPVVLIRRQVGVRKATKIRGFSLLK